MLELDDFFGFDFFEGNLVVTVMAPSKTFGFSSLNELCRGYFIFISIPPSTDFLAPGRRPNDKSYALGRRQTKPITLF